MVKSTREKVTGAFAWTLLPRAVQLVVSIFTSILIVRSLGEFEYGTLSVLRTPLALVTLLAGLGLGQALNRFVPELRVQDRANEGRALLMRCLSMQTAVWAVTTVILLALRGYLTANFPTYGDLLILGALLSVTEVLNGTLSQYAIASYRTREMAAGVTVGSLVLALATAGLLHLGLQVEGVLLGAALGQIAGLAVLVGVLRRQQTSTSASATPPAPFPTRRLLGYALPWMPNNLLNYVVWRQSETIFLGIYRTRQEAGFFDLAYKLPQLALEFLPSAVYPLLLAGFSETATVRRESMPWFVSLYYRLLYFVVAPISVLGFVLGDLAIRVLYGEPMAPAGPYAQAFFLIFAVTFLGTPLSMAVYVAEKVWVNLLLNIGYATLNVGLDILLIPRYGLLGATIPTAIVGAIVPFVRWFIARRYMPGLTIPWRFIGRCYLASASAVWLFALKPYAQGFGGLLGLSLLGILTIAISYRLLRVLGKDEREFLSRSHLPGRDLVLRLF